MKSRYKLQKPPKKTEKMKKLEKNLKCLKNEQGRTKCHDMSMKTAS